MSKGRLLAHISDVHFGREDPRVVEGLIEAITKAGPDVVVVSGDLTQRAKKRQFRAAREFLQALPKVPQIVVPGNHDVSTTNLMERALRPLSRYRRYITEDLSPFYADDEVALAGINTVRVLSTKDGRINSRQVAVACEQIRRAKEGAVRVVITHHPMDLPATDMKHALVARSRMAMKSFAQSGVDLFLSGHLHAGLTIATSARYKVQGFSAVVVHAGTAVSTRTRGEANAWNLIRIEGNAMAIRQMLWSGKRFVPEGEDRYEKNADGWALVDRSKP